MNSSDQNNVPAMIQYRKGLPSNITSMSAMKLDISD